MVYHLVTTEKSIPVGFSNKKKKPKAPKSEYFISHDIDYLILCNSMSPDERVNKGLELSEWAILTNKHIEFEIKKRIANVFCLV